VVPLSAAIAALRDELTRAWSVGQDQQVRFKPSPIELTLQVAVTMAGKGSAGVRWWLVELGGEVSRESVVTQTVKLSLEPMLFDASGKPVEFLIDAPDDRVRHAERDGEVPLDGPS
jgi:Trypsin-co-occurring domain 2